MKLAKYVQKVVASMEAEQRDALQADLVSGDLSDTALAIEHFTEQSADLARDLVLANGHAREAHSDAAEFAEVQGRLEQAREGITLVNGMGGFTLESFTWAERAVNAILAPLNCKINFSLDAHALESLNSGEKVTLSMEDIEQVIEVVAATRQDVENLSVDGILRVLAVLEEAIPDVKDRLVALQQSIRTLDYDEEAEVKLDDVVFKALAVNGQMPVGLRDYFLGYQNFCNKILSTYTENAIEAASKADFLADAISRLSDDGCPVKAIAKAMEDIGDPRKLIDADQLAFVLPGSGPLFGNKLSVEEEEEEEVIAAADGVTPPALTDEQTDGQGTGTAVSADDPTAAGEPTPGEPVDDTGLPADVQPEEDAAATAEPVEEEEQVTQDAGDPEEVETTDQVTDEPAAEPAAGEPVAAEPVTEEPKGDEPAVAPAEAEPAAEPAAPAPAEGEKPAIPPALAVKEGEEEEESDEDNSAVIESVAPDAQEGMSAVDALITKLDKFSSNYAALDPLDWEDRQSAENPTIRVLSKDTIEAVLGELIKCLEIVNIKTYGESNRQTWSKARTAFGAYKKAFENLTPQQAADLAPATEAVGEYLATVFTLSAWPALHVLTNLVFVANAFLLLSERSISGESAEDSSEDEEFNAADYEKEADAEEAGLSDEEAAEQAQANNDAMAGARAADEGATSDATVATST